VGNRKTSGERFWEKPNAGEGGYRGTEVLHGGESKTRGQKNLSPSSIGVVGILLRRKFTREKRGRGGNPIIMQDWERGLFGTGGGLDISF